MVSMWENGMAWRGTRKEERTLEKKGKPGPRGKPTVRREVEKWEPTRQARRKQTKHCPFHESHRKGSRRRVKFPKLLNIHIQKEMKLSIGFNNKDVAYDLSESSFQAAKHINQSPWVKNCTGRKQRCFSWPVLLSTIPSKGGCSAHAPVALK